MSFFTYLNNDRSDRKNLIWRCDENGFGGVFVYTIPEDFWNEDRRAIFERDKDNIVDFPTSFFTDLLSTESGWGHDWKKRYFESIPYKIDINCNLLPEPVLETTELGILYLQTIDSLRKDYLDVYAHDKSHEALFQQLDSVWNAGKEYIRTMADIIWADIE